MYGYGYQYSKISGGSVGDTLAAAYKARVEADGGTYTNGSCLVTFLNSLDPYLDNLLLDVYTGAAAAYSLRLLRTAYVGSAIRVRRSSDNTEQDIGFVSGVLDTASLLTFCGVGNGFLVTWYDQSGNARNAIQATAGNQPQIVSSGALLTRNSLPVVRFKTDNTTGSMRLQTAAFGAAISQPVTAFLAAYNATTDSTKLLFDGYNTLFSVGENGPSEPYFYARAGSTSTVGNGTLANTVGSKLFYGLFNTTSSAISINNGTEVTGDVGSNTLDGITLGGIRGIGTPISTSYEWIGSIWEAIFYPSNQSANKSAMNTNINSYYGIY